MGISIRRRVVSLAAGLALATSLSATDVFARDVKTITAVEVQEEERRAIARELHDEVGQSLTALKLLLSKARRLPHIETDSSLDEAQALANE